MKILKIIIAALLFAAMGMALVMMPVYTAPIKPEEPPKPSNIISVNGNKYHKLASVVNFSGQNITDVKAFADELSQFTKLEEINLFDTNLTTVQMAEIATKHPELVINCLVEIDGVIYDSQTTEYIDFARKNLSEKQGMELVSVMGLFKNLKKVDMCGCGYTNEQMEQFVNLYPKTKFVWEINLAGRWTVRTDAIAFSTFQGFDMEHRMTNEEAKPLKYCTDLVALDLGHNDVTDLSFLQYMPNLKILILVDAMEGIIDGEWRYIKDLSMLKHCPNLVYLEYFCNQVTDLSFLEYLPNLVDLNLSWSPVSDYTYLKNLPNIERLYMMGTSIPHQHYLELCELYPDARIERYGESSIDKGWREHPRFYAMRYTFNYNKLHPMFE